jgi:beta-lactamase class D
VERRTLSFADHDPPSNGHFYASVFSLLPEMIASPPSRTSPMQKLFIALLFAAPAATAGDAAWVEREDWRHHFESAAVKGTIAVHDARRGERFVFDASRAAVRFMPASTFKIPHALIALESGAVRDEFQVFPWDGRRHAVAGWNRDQDLRHSMRHSTVWLYQQFARDIGETREREWLARLDYGNAEIGNDVEQFWLDGSLRISAFEQIAFLERLYRNDLPFAVAHQRLVKDIMIVEAGRNWILRAKTGWGIRVQPEIGWWVGWVEHPEGPVYFALNIDLPRDRVSDMGKRESVARAALKDLGAL